MSEARRPQRILYDVLGDLNGACDERSIVLDLSGLEVGWRHELATPWLWWWVEAFVRDADLLRRMRSAHGAIGRAFVDFDRLVAATSASPRRTPAALVELVRRRVLTAWFESSREVLDFAQGPAAERAAANLKRLIEVQSWRKGSSF